MKTFIFCIIFIGFNSPIAFAHLQSIELQYDKSAVCRENKFRISMCCTTNKGKIYQSNTPNSRYQFDDFQVKTSDGISIVKSAEYLTLSIPNDFEGNEVEIELIELTNRSEIFRFKLLLINYFALIRSIQLELDSSKVTDFATLPLQVSATLVDHSTISTSNSAKIRISDFKFEVLSGGELTRHGSAISISDSSRCARELIVKTTLIADSSISHTETFPINYRLSRVYYFSTEDGYTPQNPLDAEDGKNGGILHSLNGANGLDGLNGENGGDGENGQSILVYMRLIWQPCVMDSLIEITVKDDQGKILNVLFMNRTDETIKLTSIGGNGGEGADGGDGGDGGGWSILPESRLL